MRSKFNTAWFLVVVLAVAGIVVVVQAYQTAHMPLPPPPAAKIDPKTLRYQQAVAPWKAKLSEQSLTLTWPYLGNDYAARIDLPAQQPVTLAPWDAASENKIAEEAYKDFVQARKTARLANTGACLVHVFDPGGVEVAQGTVSGVENAANAPLEPQ